MKRIKLKKVLPLLLVMLTLVSIPASEARTVFNQGNPDAKRLYDDLLSNYNKLVRPVVNTTDPLTVRIKLKLSQLIDVVSHAYQNPQGNFQMASSKKVSQEQHPYPFPKEDFTIKPKKQGSSLLKCIWHSCVRLLKQMDFFLRLRLLLLHAVAVVVKVRRVSYFMQVPLSKLRKH